MFVSSGDRGGQLWRPWRDRKVQ